VISFFSYKNVLEIPLSLKSKDRKIQNAKQLRQNAMLKKEQ